MKTMRLLPLLYFALLGSGLLLSSRLATSMNRASRPSDDFKVVAKRVVKALLRADWDALRKDAAPTIAIEQYMVVYLKRSAPLGGGLDPKLQKKLFPPEELFPSDVLESYGSTYAVVGVLVDAAQPLSRPGKEIFKNFSELVAYSYTKTPPWVKMGKDIPGYEVVMLRGPAIEGKFVSNGHWRVELERNTGRWRVNRLMIEMH